MIALSFIKFQGVSTYDYLDGQLGTDLLIFPAKKASNVHAKVKQVLNLRRDSVKAKQAYDELLSMQHVYAVDVSMNEDKFTKTSWWKNALGVWQVYQPDFGTFKSLIECERLS